MLIYGTQEDLVIPGVFVNTGYGCLIYPVSIISKDVYAGSTPTTYSLWLRWHFDRGSSSVNLEVTHYFMNIMELKK